MIQIIDKLNCLITNKFHILTKKNSKIQINEEVAKNCRPHIIGYFLNTKYKIPMIHLIDTSKT